MSNFLVTLFLHAHIAWMFSGNQLNISLLIWVFWSSVGRALHWQRSQVQILSKALSFFRIGHNFFHWVHYYKVHLFIWFHFCKNIANTNSKKTHQQWETCPKRLAWMGHKIPCTLFFFFFLISLDSRISTVLFINYLLRDTGRVTNKQFSKNMWKANQELISAWCRKI